eukprot:1146519-Pelagomonas_calceolata.AAC.1
MRHAVPKLVACHACSCMQKKCKREPLRLFVNNEPCSPSDNAGGQLSDASLELHQERRKFRDKVRHEACFPLIKERIGLHSCTCLQGQLS